MGLFGGKKTYVSSTVYNLAGDIAKRPNYLRTMVAGSIISSQPNQSVADALRDGYMSGPGVKMRQFWSWAKTHYIPDWHMDSSLMMGDPQVDPDLIAAQIGGVGSVIVQSVKFGVADYEVWAEQWMLNNHPDQFNGAWISEYNETTGNIDMTLPDASTASFTPAGFDKTALYLYATYSDAYPSSTGPVVDGDVTTVGALPDTTGWTLVSNTPDGSGGFTAIYYKDAYTGSVANSDGTFSTTQTRTFMNQVKTVAAGPPETTTYTVRYDTQVTALSTWSSLKVYIYKIGSGVAALDAAVNSTTSGANAFFPPICIKANSTLIRDIGSWAWPSTVNAYRRMTGGAKLDDLVDTLSANENFAHMNFIFVVPGVTLNTQENASRKYIFKFFENCLAGSLANSAQYSAWLTASETAGADTQSFVEWAADQAVTGSTDYGSGATSLGTYPNAGLNMVSVSMGNDTGFQIHISWQAITEEFGSGLGKVGAKSGDVWLESIGTVNEMGIVFAGALGGITGTDTAVDTIRIWQQTGANSWKRLTVYGLVHENFVYQGHSVKTNAGIALADTEESGFIIPIHWATWSSMSLTDTTQMSTASNYLVVNSYRTVTIQFWETGFFQVLFFVAIVALTIIYPPAGAAALGALLGFTGFTALVIGVLIIDVVNMIAMMILMKVLGLVATAIFGEKVGQIVAAVAAVASMIVGNGLMNGFNLADAFAQLMNPMNLIQMTEAVGNGIAHLIMDGVQDTMNKTQDVLSQYNQQSKAINDLYAQNIGYGNGIDATALAGDLTNSSQWYPEASDTFLTRTLMTGSDIAEFSTTLISRFSELTLSTDLPF